MEWTRSKCLILIELYQTYPELWDVQDKNYKDKTKKQEAWSRISDALNEERYEAERKLKNLIGQYSREMKRIRDSKKVNPAGRHYESKWFAFESLQFLNSRVVVCRKSRDTDNEINCISSENESDTTEVNKMEESHTEPKNESESVPSSSRIVPCYNRVKENEIESTRHLDKLYEKWTPKRKFDERSDDEKSTMAVPETLSTRDEYSVFGEYIACKVRKLPSNYARSTVQHFINTILWEAELGKYDNP